MSKASANKKNRNHSIIWGKSFINKPQTAQNPYCSNSPPRFIERLQKIPALFIRLDFGQEGWFA
ncbi:MAG: hypothetical protein KME28_25050 [Pelatocladus maniniholoensis HA4357-MV3]|uniref:Uncharacterized protein n=1 Tax=Pelatocladus maniniholoensis HA4357-MV3 TaxID=1117104 RepID=A0A9E3LV80_9NOST|nr:hypothetical protein [Pelatocladus maniniholoensis HA4357-MV3]